MPRRIKREKDGDPWSRNDGRRQMVWKRKDHPHPHELQEAMRRNGAWLERRYAHDGHKQPPAVAVRTMAQREEYDERMAHKALLRARSPHRR